MGSGIWRIILIQYILLTYNFPKVNWKQVLQKKQVKSKTAVRGV
jgi:hypothetical protein